MGDRITEEREDGMTLRTEKDKETKDEEDRKKEEQKAKGWKSEKDKNIKEQIGYHHIKTKKDRITS